ncbi:hypothetical protein MRB53_037414 [Persea americana]|nr:hypothetical protein MRB53_037414 [Persea americana]
MQQGDEPQASLAPPKPYIPRKPRLIRRTSSDTITPLHSNSTAYPTSFLSPGGSSNSSEHGDGKKRSRSSLFSLISVREPSALALKEYAEEQKKAAALKSSKQPPLHQIAQQKLPPTVPKVNSKWDGMPKAAHDASRKSSHEVGYSSSKPARVSSSHGSKIGHRSKGSASSSGSDKTRLRLAERPRTATNGDSRGSHDDWRALSSGERSHLPATRMSVASFESTDTVKKWRGKPQDNDNEQTPPLPDSAAANVAQQKTQAPTRQDPWRADEALLRRPVPEMAVPLLEPDTQMTDSDDSSNLPLTPDDSPSHAYPIIKDDRPHLMTRLPTMKELPSTPTEAKRMPVRTRPAQAAAKQTHVVGFDAFKSESPVNGFRKGPKEIAHSTNVEAPVEELPVESGRREHGDSAEFGRANGSLSDFNFDFSPSSGEKAAGSSPFKSGPRAVRPPAFMPGRCITKDSDLATIPESDTASILFRGSPDLRPAKLDEGSETSMSDASDTSETSAQWSRSQKQRLGLGGTIRHTTRAPWPAPSRSGHDEALSSFDKGKKRASLVNVFKRYVRQCRCRAAAIPGTPLALRVESCMRNGDLRIYMSTLPSISSLAINPSRLSPLQSYKISSTSPFLHDLTDLRSDDPEPKDARSRRHQRATPHESNDTDDIHNPHPFSLDSGSRDRNTEEKRARLVRARGDAAQGDQLHQSEVGSDSDARRGLPRLAVGRAFGEAGGEARGRGD